MWQLIVTPLASAALAQLVKVFARRPLAWNELWSSGGMPSTHAALSSSLAATVLLAEGLSPAFAVACAVTALFAIDARNLRREVGQQAQVLNRLIERQPNDREYTYPILPVRTGHTVGEILGGVALGVAVALLLWVA